MARCQHHRAGELHRSRDGPGTQPSRRVQAHGVPAARGRERRAARADGVRCAARGSADRLLRQPEGEHAGLRVDGLFHIRLSRGQPRQGGHSGKRRSRGRSVHHNSPRQRVLSGARVGEETARAYPQAAVRGAGASRHRQKDYRPRDYPSAA